MSLPGEESSDPTVCPRYQTQMPKYLNEYEVEQALDQQSEHTPPHYSNEGEETLLGATGRQSPLPNTLVADIDRSSAHEENAHFNSEALQRRLRDFERENCQLRCDLREHSTAHSSRSLQSHISNLDRPSISDE